MFWIFYHFGEKNTLNEDSWLKIQVFFNCISIMVHSGHIDWNHVITIQWIERYILYCLDLNVFIFQGLIASYYYFPLSIWTSRKSTTLILPPVSIVWTAKMISLLYFTQYSSLKYTINALHIQLSFCFYAPLEKRGILFCNCRSVCLSVGWSVGRSVDQMSSTQYLLTPSLDQYQFRAGVALNE